jgi:hypothetical protein
MLGVIAKTPQSRVRPSLSPREPFHDRPPLPNAITLPATFGSQSAAQVSMSFRRFSSASAEA